MKLTFIRELLGLVLLGVCVSATVSAQKITSAVDSLSILSAPEVKHMMESHPGVHLIHSLSAIEFNIQHIPGSINVPIVGNGDDQLLPISKQQPLIFYCMGMKCPYSRQGAIGAINQGYENVYWFRGGIPEWRKYGYPLTTNNALMQQSVKKLSPAKFRQQLKTPQVFILDTRPFWWDTHLGYVQHSISIPLVVLHTQLDLIPRDRPILLTDGFMKQSVSAAKYLQSKGYQVLGVLKGGMSRWEDEHLPTVSRQKIRYIDENLRFVTHQ